MYGNGAAISTLNPEDDQIDDSGDPRVVRGGSWNNDRNHARAASRDCVDPDSRYFLLGFRVVVVRRPPSQ